MYKNEQYLMYYEQTPINNEQQYFYNINLD